jgi:hypothetical protein
VRRRCRVPAYAAARPRHLRHAPAGKPALLLRGPLLRGSTSRRAAAAPASARRRLPAPPPAAAALISSPAAAVSWSPAALRPPAAVVGCCCCCLWVCTGRVARASCCGRPEKYLAQDKELVQLKREARLCSGFSGQASVCGSHLVEKLETRYLLIGVLL